MLSSASTTCTVDASVRLGGESAEVLASCVDSLALSVTPSLISSDSIAGSIAQAEETVPPEVTAVLAPALAPDSAPFARASNSATAARRPSCHHLAPSSPPSEAPEGSGRDVCGVVSVAPCDSTAYFLVASCVNGYIVDSFFISRSSAPACRPRLSSANSLD